MSPVLPTAHRPCYATGVAVSPKSRWKRVKVSILPLWLNERLLERSLERELVEVSSRWHPEITEAEHAARTSRTLDAQNNLASVMSGLRAELWPTEDQLQKLQTDRLLRLARRWDIDYPRQPLSETEWSESEFWEESRVFNCALLTPTGMRELRKLIRQEQWTRLQIRGIYISWVFALLGLLIAFMALLRSR